MIEPEEACLPPMTRTPLAEADGNAQLKERQAVMYKNRNIRDFFKPFAAPAADTPKPHKRARDEEEDADFTHDLSRRSKSPRVEVTACGETRSIPSSSTSPGVNADGLPPRATESLYDEPAGPAERSAETSGPTKPLAATSFVSTSSSSHRVIENGEEVVKNSDDDTDSDESLIELDDLLGRNKKGPYISPPTEIDTPRLKSSLRSATAARLKPPDGARYVPAVVEAQYKFSMASLLRDAEQHDTEMVLTESAKEMVKTLEQQREDLDSKLRRNPAHDQKLTEGLITNVISKHKESHELDRIMHAIRRTEALSRTKTWSFFDEAVRIRPERHDFPVLAKSHLTSLFAAPKSREHTFISGFAEDLAIQDSLPDAVNSWILHGSIKKTSERMWRSYLGVISCQSSQRGVFPCRSDIIDLFSALGARDTALDEDVEIVPDAFTVEREDALAHDWSQLRQVLLVLKMTAMSLEIGTLQYSILVLLRLCLDATVMADTRNSLFVASAFESLVASIPDADVDEAMEEIMREAYNTIKDTEFRIRLLRAVPATSPRLHSLRRHLALAFFFSSEQYLSLAVHAPAIKTFNKHIVDEPMFSITPSTDYVLLSTTIAILDIAIDSGDPPIHFQAVDMADTSTSVVTSAATTDTRWQKRDTSLLKGSTTTKRRQSPTQIFNSQLDTLITTLQSLHAKIVDTGASHMSRTEAKNVVEALYTRLLHGVRTAPRQRKGIFDVDGSGADDDEGLGYGSLKGARAGMSRFLAAHTGRKEKEKAEAEGLEAEVA